MNHQSPTPEALIAAALEITDAAAQRAFLDRACEGNEALRREVESLLVAHEQAGSFMTAKAAKAMLPGSIRGSAPQ